MGKKYSQSLSRTPNGSEKASYRRARRPPSNPQGSSRRGARTRRWSRRSTRSKCMDWTCVRIMASADSSVMWHWPWWQEIFTASAPCCGNRSKSVRTEKRSIPIVRHPTSARLKKPESLFCDRHDFSNHANLFVQKLTKFTFPFAITEKLCLSHIKTRKPHVALKS